MNRNYGEVQIEHATQGRNGFKKPDFYQQSNAKHDLSFQDHHQSIKGNEFLTDENQNYQHNTGYYNDDILENQQEIQSEGSPLGNPPLLYSHSYQHPQVQSNEFFDNEGNENNITEAPKPQLKQQYSYNDQGQSQGYTNNQEQEEQNQQEIIDQENINSNENNGQVSLQNMNISNSIGGVNAYENCPNCQRQFFEGKLHFHLKLCTKNKPYKVPKKLQDPQNIENQVQKSDLMPSSQKRLQGNNTNYAMAQSPQIQNFNSSQDQFQYNPNQNRKLSDSGLKRPIPPRKASIKNEENNINQLNEEELYQMQERKQQVAYYEQQAENILNQQQQQTQNNEEGDDDDSRQQCELCGRKFMAERIEKHISVCGNAQKKRKVFNSKKNRMPECDDAYKYCNAKQNNLKFVKVSEQYDPMKAVEEAKKNNKKQPEQQLPPWKQKGQQKQQQNNTTTVTEAEQEECKTNTTADTLPAKKMPKWKAQHISFQMQMKKNKGQNSDQDNLDQEMEDPTMADYVKCQYCQRKFHPLTAERHIPLCKDIINRPKPYQNNKQKNNNKMGDRQVGLQKGTPPRPPGQKEKPTLNKQPTFTANTIIDEQDEDQGQQHTQRRSQRDGNLLKSGISFRITQGSGLKKQDSSQTSMSNYQNRSTFQSTLSGTNEFMQGEKRSISVNKPKSNKLLPEINSRKSNSNNFYMAKKYAGQEQEEENNAPRQRIGTSPVKTYYNNNNNNPKSLEGGQLINKFDGVKIRSSNYSNIECPHCDRVFARAAAERHIPICKTILNKPKPLIREQRYGTQQLPANNPNLTNNNFGPKRQSPNGMYLNSSSAMHCKAPFCTNCGQSTPTQHKYCGNCGKKK